MYRLITGQHSPPRSRVGLDFPHREEVMPLADKLQEAATKYIAEIVLGFVLSGLTAIALLADWLLPPAAFEALGSFATGRILLGLFLALLGLVAWVVYLHPRLIFDERAGCFVHKRTGMRYCSKCRIEKRLRSPMLVDGDGSGWRCPVCRLFYRNPDYQEAPQPRQSDGRNSWMRI